MGSLSALSAGPKVTASWSSWMQEGRRRQPGRPEGSQTPMIPASDPGRRRLGHPLILTAVAAVALGAGVTVAVIATAGSLSLASSSGQLAATPSPSPSASKPGNGPYGPRSRFPGRGKFGGGFGLGAFGALH